MADIVLESGKSQETEESRVVVDSGGLKPGRHVFRLVVVDDDDNESAPDEVTVIVRDDKVPTAILNGPGEVVVGEGIRLDGTESSDVGEGKVVKYIWTMVS